MESAERAAASVAHLSDKDIAREIREGVARKMLWIEPDRLRVVVETGEVLLTGSVDTQTPLGYDPTTTWARHCSACGSESQTTPPPTQQIAAATCRVSANRCTSASGSARSASISAPRLSCSSLGTCGERMMCRPFSSRLSGPNWCRRAAAAGRARGRPAVSRRGDAGGGGGRARPSR